MHKKQLMVFGILLFMYAMSTFVYVAFLYDQVSMGLPVPEMEVEIAPWLLGLANAGIVLVLYGLLGLAGYWFARRLELPGVFSDNSHRRGWVWIPMLYGAICGIALVIADILFALMGLEDFRIFNFRSPFWYHSARGLERRFCFAVLSLACGHSCSI